MVYHKIGTYKINKISLSCFDDKLYIQNNGYDASALGYKSFNYIKNSVSKGSSAL